MRTTRRSMVLLMLCGFATLPQAAHARATVEITKLQGDGAFAEFQYAQGDIVTYISVITTAFEVLRPPQPGGPKREPMTVISLFRANGDGDIIFSAVGSSVEQSFTVADGLETGRLQTRVLMQDVQSGSFMLDVDLVWNGDGELVRDRARNNHYSSPEFVFNARFHGEHRPALATGTIIGVGENFTPVASSTAELHSNKSGLINVQVK